MQKKTEDGFNAVNYVFYLVIILTVCIVFACARFLDGVRVAEQTCDQGLHLIESGVLAINAKKETIGFMADSGMKRVNIVTAVDNGSTMTTAEQSQLSEIGNYIEQEFQKRMSLKGSHPSGGILSFTCGEDSDVLLTNVVIYDPVYEVQVYAGDLSLSGTFETKFWDSLREILQAWTNGDVEKLENWPEIAKEYEENPGIVPTVTLGNITGWVRYQLQFDSSNHYTGATKAILGTTAPVLNADPSVGMGGNITKQAEGASIEMSMKITVRGVKQIFAESSAAGSSLTKVDPLFVKNPQAPETDIIITQAADIVPAERDLRKR